MEYNDYINYHAAFSDVPSLNNPYGNSHYYTNSHVSNKKVITPWFTLEQNKFTITSTVPHWPIVHTDENGKATFPLTIPKNIKISIVKNEVLINNHPIHINLTIDPNTGKTLNYLYPARPLSDEDQTAAVSMLRKHISAYKKRARPIYRLLKGGLRDSTTNENHSSYSGGYRTDKLTTHEVYDILKTCKPTTDELDFLLTNGNSSSSNGNGYFEKTDFESALSRVINRRRSDLRAYALLEVDNEYKTPKEIKNL